ncbi:MAG: hypothetical protein ACR2LC_14880 [Pyrinomonadaceae bacterium]
MSQEIIQDQRARVQATFSHRKALYRGMAINEYGLDNATFEKRWRGIENEYWAEALRRVREDLRQRMCNNVVTTSNSDYN